MTAKPEPPLAICEATTAHTCDPQCVLEGKRRRYRTCAPPWSSRRQHQGGRSRGESHRSAWSGPPWERCGIRSLRVVRLAHGRSAGVPGGPGRRGSTSRYTAPTWQRCQEPIRPHPSQSSQPRRLRSSQLTNVESRCRRGREGLAAADVGYAIDRDGMGTGDARRVSGRAIPIQDA